MYIIVEEKVVTYLLKNVALDTCSLLAAQEEIGKAKPAYGNRDPFAYDFIICLENKTY
jgi:hypothetical protein